MVQRSFLSDLNRVENNLEDVRKVFLQKLADQVVYASPNPTDGGSPVDTGAYVRSHSIGTSTGLGGKQSSHGKPKDNGSAREEAHTKLYSQIEALPEGSTKVYMGNRSPHASAVETGWPTKNGFREGYHVYATLRGRAKVFIQEAKNEVWGRQ